MTKLSESKRPYNPTHFECSSHPGTMLTGLQALRRQGLLLDVTLHVGGESFSAHKAVLAACSDYFRAMFTDAMKVSGCHWQKERCAWGQDQHLKSFSYVAIIVMPCVDLLLGTAGHCRLFTDQETTLSGQMTL